MVIQKRLMRKNHPDSHYAAALFRYEHETHHWNTITKIGCISVQCRRWLKSNILKCNNILALYRIIHQYFQVYLFLELYYELMTIL